MSDDPVRYTVKDMPEDSRPRERLLREGAEHLSPTELLAIVLRTGSTRESALGLAERLLKRFQGLEHLWDCSVEELTQVEGIGPAKVAQIKAAIELGRRTYRARAGGGPTIRTPEDAFDLLRSEMRYYDREHIVSVSLDSKNKVLGTDSVSIGTVNSAVAHPRECFKGPIRRSAAAVLFAHNHPSGDPTPSAEDLRLAGQLQEAGRLLGIEVVDHLILGHDSYRSLKELGAA